MSHKFLRYNTTKAITYSVSAKIPVEKNCNGYIATNLGDTIAEVNGMALFPSAAPATIAGDSISVGGNENEIYKGTLQLKFRTPIGATPLVEIVQKFYVEEDC